MKGFETWITLPRPMLNIELRPMIWTKSQKMIEESKRSNHLRPPIVLFRSSASLPYQNEKEQKSVNIFTL